MGVNVDVEHAGRFSVVRGGRSCRGPGTRVPRTARCNGAAGISGNIIERRLIPRAGDAPVQDEDS